MSSMTSTGPMANSVLAVAPHNRNPVTPGAMPRVPLYPCNQPQVYLISGNPPGVEPPVCEPPVQRILKEGKTLGAIQILIGLIHIGLGSVMGTITNEHLYSAASFSGGFPFWGGIWFILSGSFSVSAEKQPRSTCLLKSSLVLNIISAICSVSGFLLLTVDMSLTTPCIYIYPNFCSSSDVTTEVALYSVLLIFCLLEFCTACTSAHFSRQLVSYSHNNVGVVYPNVFVANPMVIPEPASAPPPSCSREAEGST